MTATALFAVDHPPIRTATPCQTAHEDLWFSQTPDVIERAKSLCAACPLKAACLDGAMERGEPWGVWGGELVLNGQIVARKRGRGRPRKSEAAA